MTNVPNTGTRRWAGPLQVVGSWMYRLESIILLLAGLSLVIMMLLITANAMGRHFLTEPIVGTTEVVTLYLMGMIVWFSMARTEYINRHVQIDLVVRRFPQTVQRVLRVISLVLSAFTVGIIIYAAWGSLLENWGTAMVGAIPFPLGISRLVIVVGAAALFLRMLLKIAEELCGADTTADR